MPHWRTHLHFTCTPSSSTKGGHTKCAFYLETPRVKIVPRSCSTYSVHYHPRRHRFSRLPRDGQVGRLTLFVTIKPHTARVLQYSRARHLPGLRNAQDPDITKVPQHSKTLCYQGAATLKNPTSQGFCITQGLDIIRVPQYSSPRSCQGSAIVKEAFRFYSSKRSSFLARTLSMDGA